MRIQHDQLYCLSWQGFYFMMQLAAFIKFVFLEEMIKFYYVEGNYLMIILLMESVIPL